MTRSPGPPPVLLATGTVASRPYTLAVGLHALGVWLPAHETARGARPEFATVVHHPPRTATELRGVVDVAVALAYGFHRQRYVLGV